MLGRVQGNSTGNGYFTQAVAEYAKQAKPQEGQKESSSGKAIGEFSKKEWGRLLDKVDASIEEYKEGLRKREKEALDKKQEQEEAYIFGKGTKGQQEYEATVMWEDTVRTMRFHKINPDSTSGTEGEKDKLEIMDAISDEIREEAIQRLIGKRSAPYSALADKDGNVMYNGVTFQCDFENNRLCLGDVSNPNNCLNIPLEKGGNLVVNRDNIDGLVQAIGMFSPADINRIMQAIAKDAKVRQIKLQIEDETSGERVLEKEDGKTEENKALGEEEKPAGNPVLEGIDGTADEAQEAAEEKNNAMQEEDEKEREAQREEKRAEESKAKKETGWA